MNSENFIDGILDDYARCLDDGAFISCKEVLTNILDEAFWDAEGNNKWVHYKKHVCAEGEEYTGAPADRFNRIKFPNMKYSRYLTCAERLADTTPVESHMSEDGVFGWKAKIGVLHQEVCLKFRKSRLKSADGNDLYEYVAYRTVNGQPTSKKIESGGVVSYRYYYEIADRAVFSYGLVEDPANTFERTDSLSPAELKEGLCQEHMHRVTEELLTEANRQQLLQKSRKGKSYSDSNQSKGRNRYERRMKSSISATVKDYNMIQMDPLFKRDILEFRIPVIGESDVYVVDFRVDGLLSEIRKQLMANKGELEFKVVLQSLMKVLNMGNVFIGCNCPDARYRMAYQQTKNDYKAGYKERRPSNITNPMDDLGAGCKHVLLVLANLDWAVKVASVINNYIKYCKEHLQRNYADYIFPKIYGMKYDKAVQLSLFDNGLFPQDRKTIDAVIDKGMSGKDKLGKFTKGNDYRFKKKEQPQPEPEQGNQPPEDENPLELKFSRDEEEPEETPETEG